VRVGKDKLAGRFISNLERLLGRRVRPMPVGRPRKNKRVKKERKTVIYEVAVLSFSRSKLYRACLYGVSRINSHRYMNGSDHQ